MKRRVFAIVSVVILTLGIGTAVYAAEVGPGTFREMLPHMKERHSNMSDSDLEQMYKNCHSQEVISNTRGMM